MSGEVLPLSTEAFHNSPLILVMPFLPDDSEEMSSRSGPRSYCQSTLSVGVIASSVIETASERGVRIIIPAWNATLSREIGLVEDALSIVRSGAGAVHTCQCSVSSLFDIVANYLCLWKLNVEYNRCSSDSGIFVSACHLESAGEASRCWRSGFRLALYGLFVIVALAGCDCRLPR